MDPSVQPVTTPVSPASAGSRDGLGAGDHDQAYAFGQRPTSEWTYPFTGRQFARLLVLRGRVRDGEFSGDSGR